MEGVWTGLPRGKQVDLDEVFRSVYRRNYAVLLRVASSIVGDAEIGEDLCQEALLKYYQRVAFLPHGEEARYWLLRVLRNLALNFAKRRQRERKAIRLYYHNSRHNGCNEGEKRTLEDDAAAMVREAVLALPGTLRSVIVLKEYGLLSYAEISKALGITVDNVKVRVFRARARLATLLDQEAVYVS